MSHKLNAKLNTIHDTINTDIVNVIQASDNNFNSLNEEIDDMTVDNWIPFLTRGLKLPIESILIERSLLVRLD